ncbi:MAG: conjugal transfer protein TraF [Rhizobacter sp.]
MKTHWVGLPAAAILWAVAFTIVGPVSVGSAVAQVTATGDESADSERDSYWQDGNRGWFFYERKPKKPPALPPAPAPIPAPAPVVTAPTEPPKPPKHPDLVRFEALQKRVEDTRNIAIVNPTEENLRAFLTAQAEALDKAITFGKASERVVWATPSLDPDVRMPTTPAGLALYEGQRDQRRTDKWAELAQTHAFFFFFKSDCPYCHRFAPMLRDFSQRTGIEILPVSLDGIGIQEFPDFRPDNGIAARLGITEVPALFLAEPRTGKVLPVGYGVIGPNDLERRLDMITQPAAESTVPSTVKFVGDLARR